MARSRSDALVVAQNLRRLIDHPGTPPAEAENARSALNHMIEKHGFTEVELSRSPTTHLTPEQEELIARIYNPGTGHMDFDAIDKLIDYVEDPKAKTVLKGVTGVVRMFDVLFGTKGTKGR